MLLHIHLLLTVSPTKLDTKKYRLKLLAYKGCLDSKLES